MGGDRAKRNAPKRHRRRSIRLKGYDYTRPGAYFITICTHNREPLFGRVVDGEMVLNEYGEIVWEEWFRSAKIRDEIELFPDEFVVMPNHVHGIVWIVETRDHTPPVGATGRSPLQIQSAHPRGPVARSLGSFIAGFKSAVTRRINEMRGTPGARVWQRNYYEHIIRNERALNAIRRYIVENPLRWRLDRYNPDRQGTDPMAQEIWHLIHPPNTKNKQKHPKTFSPRDERRTNMNRTQGPEQTRQEKPLTREAVLRLLAQHREELRRRFRVKSLALFGSVARNEAGPRSDVDILVAFEGPATFDGYMELKFYLEDLLGCRVDLVTPRALKPRVRPYVEKEAVYVP